jgi:hypothetical protein
MPTTFVKGDIFEDPGQGGGTRAFAFAASTGGTLDAGIGVAFAKRHPGLAAALADRVKSGELAMGEVFTWKEGQTTVFVLGLLRKVKPAKISNVSESLTKLVERAKELEITRIAVPRIGGAKTDLDWMRVKRVLTEVGEASNVELVVYQQFVRGGAVAPADASDDANEG